MNGLIYIAPIAVIGILFLPLIPVIRGMITGKRASRRFVTHLGAFTAVVFIGIVFFSVGLSAAVDNTAPNISAAAEENDAGGELSSAKSSNSDKGLMMIAAALPTFGSCIGGGIAVSTAAAAAIGAISENPKAFGKAIIFVALGEGVALYGLVLSIMLMGRI